MSTFTVLQKSPLILPERFETFFDLYLYLIDNVIDLDVREHDREEFSARTQQKIWTIQSRPFSSFINL